MADYIDEVYKAVLNYDKDSVVSKVKDALEHGVDPLAVMNKGLSKAIVEIGDRFGKEEIFLVELMVGAEACMAGIELVKQKLLEEKVDVGEPKGVVVIGTVEGDIHNIGKDIVKTLLQTSGFEVHDIGVDQSAESFVNKTLEVNAKVVASSALLTTTAPNQRKIEEKLRGAGLKGNVKTIIGGAATNPQWAHEIGADFYASTATEGINIIKKIFGGE
jgi:corrinoid protein of di/trimethylamine methyltransferase